MGEVHVAAWQSAYRGLLSDEFLDSLDAPTRAEHWRGALTAATQRAEVPDGGSDPHNLVGEIDGSVVAIATVGPYRDRPAGDMGELWMINVEPSSWGTGIATELLGVAVERLVGMNCAGAVLWVIDRNLRARRFYEKHGWRVDGESKAELVGDREIIEVRYAIAL